MMPDTAKSTRFPQGGSASRSSSKPLVSSDEASAGPGTANAVREPSKNLFASALRNAAGRAAGEPAAREPTTNDPISAALQQRERKADELPDAPHSCAEVLAAASAAVVAPSVMGSTADLAVTAATAAATSAAAATGADGTSAAAQAIGALLAASARPGSPVSALPAEYLRRSQHTAATLPGDPGRVLDATPVASQTWSLEQVARQLETSLLAQAVAPGSHDGAAAAAAPANSTADLRHGAMTDALHPDVIAATQLRAPDPLTQNAAATPVVARLDASVGSLAWQDQLANQLTWMLGRGEHLATLRLSPDHLGPLEVNIAVRGSDATVWFGALQVDTRAALEAALPRLRDMMAAQGIALLQSGVSRDAPRQPPRGPLAAPVGATDNASSDAAIARVSRVRILGLIDLYA